MNAVEIEEAVSTLAEAPFEAVSFPFAFLEAFGNKETTLKRLRSGDSNQSDIPGAVLQRTNIHIKVCAEGQVTATLAALRESPKTASQKVKFILATDGISFEAENVVDGETVACAYPDFHNHLGFFLPLAGITTVKQIRENAFDIKATSRLNKLYIELIKENPEWGTVARREDLNHFMARLIFCFFAEDTAIFGDNARFTATVEKMSARDSSNTHEIISELFRAMNVPTKHVGRLDDRYRKAANTPNWAKHFPYVNGGLFSGSVDVPRFSKIARSYLLHVGTLDWTKINPDIFGSMIQAVADDEERGALGMHYTSVPNILKVLNPLFLDDLRAKLEEAGNNPRKLLNLRQRIARIRVFDPACGSGNFLVIAYKELRAIEAEINRRRGEAEIQSAIPLTNFRGIELRHFSCEIARLALIIAEYQCDVLYRGQQLALAEFLPLEAANWITCGNALRLDWLSICPPTSKGVKLRGDDLFETPLDQAEIDFANEGGETYICGNPPYKGSNWRSNEQTSELGDLLSAQTKAWKALDYVAGWIIKAAQYSEYCPSSSSFVTTNSICQGQQAAILWPLVFSFGQSIAFAHTSFKWANLASHNAGVSVIVVGLSSTPPVERRIFDIDKEGKTSVRVVSQINAYLLNAKNVFVEAAKVPLGFNAHITDGSGALDGGNLILDVDARNHLLRISSGRFSHFVRPYIGSSEFIRGTSRWCLWIEDDQVENACQCDEIKRRIQAVRSFRNTAGSRAKTAVGRPNKFAWINKRQGRQILIPTVFSEAREFVTAGYMGEDIIINNAASIVQDAQPDIFSIISSSLHICWVRAIAGRLKTDLRYTSALCYNTFPVPTLTEQNKADLTRCAEGILLAREAHFPATIADLYDPAKMPADLRAAHERNDETLERIYIGRRFKNDTERLEKLFELYTQMAGAPTSLSVQRGKKPSKKP